MSHPMTVATVPQPVAMQPVMMQPGAPMMMQPMANPGMVMMQPMPGAAPVMMQPGMVAAVPQYVAAPGVVMQQTYGVVAPTSGYQILAALQTVRIKQKVEMLEVVTGIETENKYKIEMENGTDLFKAVEKSDFCSRNCLPGSARPFEMKISLDSTKQPFLRLHRPFTCTFLCLARPYLDVFEQDQAGSRIGRVVQPFTCCNHEFNVFDQSETLVYTIWGNCCQCGFLNWPCCMEVEFEIRKHGEPVGKIRREFPGCGKAMATDADSFVIHFPADASPQHKALLISATFFIDFRFFEKNSCSSNSNH
eukprot:GILI01007151.1.p1 GENE.GILI01007151.1~~GILI01007151.1.p1  ORF type:complete len:331 (+),score=97.10 GILI01007151.1:76-993(+)